MKDTDLTTWIRDVFGEKVYRKFRYYTNLEHPDDLDYAPQSVGAAFIWMDTTEGVTFWSEIHRARIVTNLGGTPEFSIKGYNKLSSILSRN